MGAVAGLPDVLLTVQDGNLASQGAGLSAVEQTACVVGVCTGSYAGSGTTTVGAPGTALQFGDVATLQSQLGAGSAVELAAYIMSIAGGAVVVAPVTSSYGTAGASGAMTHAGTGAVTGAVTFGPTQPITIVVILGGNVATATFTFQIGSGPVSPTIVTAATFAVPGTFCTLGFSSGGGAFVLGDTYVVAPNGVVTQTVGSGAGAVSISSAGPIQGITSLILTILVGGAVSAPASYQYSLDGGISQSGTFATSTGVAAYALPGTGIIVTFSSTSTALVAGDTYTIGINEPTVSNANIKIAMDAAVASGYQFSMFHVCGGEQVANETGFTAANGITRAGTLDSNVSTYFGQHNFYRVLTGNPYDASHNTDAANISAAAAFASTRVGIGEGHVQLSSLIGFAIPRNVSWTAIARACAVKPVISLARVKDGPIGGVEGATPIDRDERLTPGPSAARYITARTFASGKQGIFITLPNMMATNGSDFSELSFGRVMDLACRVAYAGMLAYLNDTPRTNANGSIYEVDAQAMEADVNSQLEANVVNTGNAPSAAITISRTANIASTHQLPFSVSVGAQPPIELLVGTMGFVL